MDFSFVIESIQEGTYGNISPTSVFLNKDDWQSLFDKYPKSEKHIRHPGAQWRGLEHFMISGVPVMRSEVNAEGVVTIVNHDQVFQPRFNFSRSIPK